MSTVHLINSIRRRVSICLPAMSPDGQNAIDAIDRLPASAQVRHTLCASQRRLYRNVAGFSVVAADRSRKVKTSVRHLMTAELTPCQNFLYGDTSCQYLQRDSRRRPRHAVAYGLRVGYKRSCGLIYCCGTSAFGTGFPLIAGLQAIEHFES